MVSLASKRGSALLGIMVVAVVVAILGTALVVAMGGESRSSSRQVSAAQALALADAGVEYVFARLVDENIQPEDIEDAFDTPTVLGEDEWTKGETEVVVESPEPENYIAIVTSTGIVEGPGYRRTVRAHLTYGPAISFTRTAVSYDPEGEIELDGGVVLSGGIHANGDITTSGNSQALDVSGPISACGTISPLLTEGVYSDPWDGPSQQDIDALRDKAIAEGEYYPSSLTVKPPGPDPRVYEGLIFIDGNLKFQGNVNVSGFAVWIVTGTIDFSNTGYVEGFFYSNYQHPTNNSITVGGNTQIAGSLVSNGSIKLNGTIGAGGLDEIDEDLLPRRWRRTSWEETG